MNRFGSRDTQRLIDRLRSEVAGLQKTVGDGPEHGLVGVLQDAADTLDAANLYYAAVECALV